MILSSDLAHFPAPFFDERDTHKLVLPVLFAGSPTLLEQQAAAILTSYFGSLAGWRGAVLALVSLTGMLTLGAGLSPVVARPRPSPELVRVFRPFSGYGFPSLSALWFAGTFGFLAILAAVGGIARIVEGISLIGFGLLGAVVSVATGAAAVTASPGATTVDPATTVPPGPGESTLGPSARAAKTTVGGTLGIYPGQWWAPASPVVIVHGSPGNRRQLRPQHLDRDRALQHQVTRAIHIRHAPGADAFKKLITIVE